MPRKTRPSSSDPGQPDLFGGVVPVAGDETGAVRRFLGWERPLARAVAEHVAAAWDGRGMLDLGGWMIVVPTRNASRRLRESLAALAAEKDAAVLPPRVVTPDFVSSPDRLEGTAGAANGVESLLIWTAELMRLNLDDYRHLFPIDPVERGFNWALKTAGDLLDLRETVNEKGLSLADVSRLLEGTEMEPERWRDLARIERLCVRATEHRGYADRQDARRQAASLSEPPSGTRRVVMAGVLDPSALAVEALRSWSRRVPVEVLIYAPEASHGVHFDDWGRPVADGDAWLGLTIEIPAPEATIHQGGSPAEQAEVAVELIAGHDDPGAVAAIGVADPEIVAPLEKGLAARGIGAFDPAGRLVGTHGVFHLLRILSRLAASRSFSAVAELIRCPDVADAIRRAVEAQTGVMPTLNRLLDDLDTLSVKSLPDTLDDAIELAPRVFHQMDRPSAVPTALEWIQTALGALEGPNFGGALTDFLSEVFAARKFHRDRPGDAVFTAIADQIVEVLDALDGPAARGFPEKLDAGNRLELLLLALGDQVYYPDRRARDIDLQGWLELLWEDAPHLVITGMNDGKAPEAILGHPFLPDSARRVLGLRHNDTRFARDACVLTALIESRRLRGGRVDFVFGRTGAADEPLRPSRLLFQCPEAELPARTLHFFQKPRRHADPMPWRLAWKLRPDPLPDEASVFHKISVTQFRTYLMCPFRFFLRHGLRMEEIDATRTEMDFREFGSLLHGVLEDFALDPEAADLAEAGAIREVFHRILDRHLHRTYGPRLTVPVTVQRASARQRLGWWAEHEASQRRLGWRIVAAESRISPEDDPWTLGGMKITGTVDRVERHDEHGIRLLDFKTHSPYDAAKRARKTVEEYHVARLKRAESPSDFPEWKLTRFSSGADGRWIDLQLPLYRLAMERRYPGEAISTAHVTLGKTKADIGLDVWPELEGPLLERARACAEGVTAAIRAREFWPPAERLPFGDDFGKLFFGDPLEAVEESALLAAAEEQRVE